MNKRGRCVKRTIENHLGPEVELLDVVLYSERKGGREREDGGEHYSAKKKMLPKKMFLQVRRELENTSEWKLG